MWSLACWLCPEESMQSRWWTWSPARVWVDFRLSGQKANRISKGTLSFFTKMDAFLTCTIMPSLTLLSVTASSHSAPLSGWQALALYLPGPSLLHACNISLAQTLPDHHSELVEQSPLPKVEYPHQLFKPLGDGSLTPSRTISEKTLSSYRLCFSAKPHKPHPHFGFRTMLIGILIYSTDNLPHQHLYNMDVTSIYPHYTSLTFPLAPHIDHKWSHIMFSFFLFFI